MLQRKHVKICFKKFHGKHPKHDFSKNVGFMRRMACRQNTMFYSVLHFLPIIFKKCSIHATNGLLAGFSDFPIKSGLLDKVDFPSPFKKEHSTYYFILRSNYSRRVRDDRNAKGVRGDA